MNSPSKNYSYFMCYSPDTPLVLARDSHIKPDSEAGGLIWVEGWYQGRYGKFHVINFLSHILHWPFPSIDLYTAKKVFELTNYENKFLRELPLFNLQIFLFKFMTWNFPYRPWYQPSTHISPPASLSGLIWESRANTRADMENVM
jgi:hypothetical protein